MHNSFIEPNQLQNVPDSKRLKDPFTGLLAITSCVIHARSVPNTVSVVAVSVILITMITGTVELLQ